MIGEEIGSQRCHPAKIFLKMGHSVCTGSATLIPLLTFLIAIGPLLVLVRSRMGELFWLKLGNGEGMLTLPFQPSERWIARDQNREERQRCLDFSCLELEVVTALQAMVGYP